MGILDFLGDLSSKRSKELGLGGLQSLLGTRGAAQAGATGDEMMKITGGDSLPGYYDPNTREYVPWYVDLFDGGGFNSAGGAISAEQPKGIMDVAAKGPSIAQKELMGGGNIELSDMERLNRMSGSDPRNMGGGNIELSDMERLNRMPGSDPRNMGGASGYGQTGVSPLDPFGGAGPTIPVPTATDPFNVPFADFSSAPMGVDERNLGGAVLAAEYQKFVQYLTKAGGFERELQDPEWLLRTFQDGKAKGRL